MRRSAAMSVAPGVRVFTLVLVIAGALLSRPALAYDTYSENGDATNCGSCHGDFRSSPYRSLVDGQSWGDDLHDVHRNTMLDGDCETCHGSNKFPVLIGSSSGGSGLSAFSCSGCHGRSQDGTGSGTQGFGAGLRQRHWRAGTQLCVNCHSDANPANKVVARENVLPPYYANPGTNHPGIPANPCNPAPSYPENFAATTRGLDNDGDGSYDGADPDCMTAVCGNGALETGEQCDDGNTAAGDCCSAACRFEASGSTCNDGLYCTVNETCNGTGSCGSGQARSCGDAFACTSDSCNETTDACVHAPSNALCDDGLYCNGAETCDAAAGCRPGTTVNCADTNICTDDNCNEATNLCDHVLDPTNDPSCVIAVCGNGVREGAEVCDGDDLAGRTCQSEGFAGGTLGCLSGCSGVDTSSCTSDPNTVLVRIAAGSDDAEESAAGSVSLTSSDLELVYDGSDQVVGLRFTGLAIPRGARIVDAWVRFTAAGTQSEVTQITIQGEAVDNPPTFASSSNDVSARTRTSASVSWAPPAWVAVGDAGADQRTPNLAPILQEIVNRPGWTSGNPLVLLFSGSGQRTAQAYEGSTGLAPLLRVQLGVPPSTVNGLRRTDTR